MENCGSYEQKWLPKRGFIFRHIRLYNSQALYRQSYQYKKFFSIYTPAIGSYLSTTPILCSLLSRWLFFIGKNLDAEKVMSFVSTVLLLNSANNTTSWFNFASWSVSAEWISYLCFGVIFSQLTTGISKSLKVIVCVGIIILSYLWCNTQSSHSGLEYITQNAGWARGLGGFFGGTLGYLIWPQGLSIKNVSGILLVFFSFLFLKGANTSLDYSFIIIAILLVAWLASEPAQHTFLKHPILLWIGKISYSIYLGHTFIGSITEKLLGLTGLNINFYLVFLIKLGCLLILSELTYRWIENPCRLFVRNYSNKKAAQ